MITLFGCAHFSNFVSLLFYPTEVKQLKCAMLGAFTVFKNLDAALVAIRLLVKKNSCGVQSACAVF